MAHNLHLLKEKVYFWARTMTYHVIYAWARRLRGTSTATIDGYLKNSRAKVLTAPDSGITFPREYMAYVNALYAEVKEAMHESAHCIFHSADASVIARLKNSKGSTWDLPELQQRFVGSVRLRDTIQLRHLKPLCELVVPNIEKYVYGCPVRVYMATVYRHLPSSLAEYGSILWHSDNHLQEELKLMIYFNEVGDDQAPFEILRKKSSHETITIPASMPRKYPRGRVPQEVIDRYVQEGYECFKFYGPQGTALLFDEKIIHKGNYAKQGYRDVLVLQFRPTLFKTPPFIGRAWTRSY